MTFKDTEFAENLRDRFLKINPNPHSKKLSDDSVDFIITKQDALSLLGCSPEEFHRLVTIGAIRKAHVGTITGLYCRADVETLHYAEPHLKHHIETQLRYRNGSCYLDKFTPALFYTGGKQLSEGEITTLEAEAASAYANGFADNTYIYRRLVAPASNPRPPKPAIEWLYLTDENPPQLTTALQMRRWNKESTSRGDYNINSITLPPPEAMGKIEHRNVLRFLVQAASDLYGIKFDSTPHSLYHRVEEINSLDICEFLTGTAIPHIASALPSLEHYKRQYSPQIPNLKLIHSIPLWYIAYRSMLISGKFQLRGLTPYLNEVLREVRRTNEVQGKPALTLLRKSLKQQLGAFSTWRNYYSEKVPPLYIGCLPFSYPYERGGNPRTPLHLLHPHDGVDLDSLPTGISLRLERLATTNKISLTNYAKLQIVVDVLADFHRGIALQVLQSTSEVPKFGAMKVLAIKLMAGLTKRGISPESVYLYPIRDADILYSQMFAREEGARLFDDVISEVNYSITPKEEQT